ncbi:MAG: RecX family transcriptional regulator [Flavobacteriales bacterium]|nr:RecX family transcriptional regulator [Flavobacteriales bacterium]MBT6816008.1 RecX family transcriptional regulator [Flavobacteriales bacterium]MBT7727088.1 RecX family transcriptional regulator [Flavobacteriales bacterium]
MQNNKVYTVKEATERIQSYCAMQDRCQWEVEKKMKEWGISDEIIENILTDLILDKFVNEERFSESFCRGKFRIKRWGKVKIKNELKIKKISNNCIDKGLLQIEKKEYVKVLKDLYLKKRDSLKDTNQFIRKGKIAKHLQQKGFESKLIWELINKDK